MDPYTPPGARIDDLSIPTPSQLPRLVAVATAIQAVGVCFYAKTYATMIDSGEVAPIVGLLALVSCVLLYVGAVRFARNAGRGRYLFLLSALGLETAWCGWSKFYFGPYPLLMGAIVAAIGCLTTIWLRRNKGLDRKEG